MAWFHEIALLTGWLSFDRLQVCSRSILATRVLWMALEISCCSCQGNLPKLLWSSTFYAIALDRLFELCSFVGRSQDCFAMLLAWTRGRNFQSSSKGDCTKFLACPFRQDCHFVKSIWMFILSNKIYNSGPTLFLQIYGQPEARMLGNSRQKSCRMVLF